MTALVSRAARHRPWPSRAVLGVGSGAAVLGICAGGCALVAANVAAGAPAEDGPDFWPMLLVGAVSYAVVGAWLVARRTAGLLGPVFLGVALCLAAALTTRAYGVHGLQVVDGLPGDRWAFWVAAWVWVPGLLSLLTVVPHLVPDGALASRRWRPALAVSVVAVTVATLSWAVTPYERLDGPALDAAIGPNPVAVPAATSGLVDLASGPVLLAGVALAVASLVLRWRHADPDRRRALAWVLYGVGVSVACTGIAILLDVTALSAVSMAALPVCFLVAVTRHRLWDLQIVVRRSLVYGGLTAIVAAAYAGIVGLLGGAVGASTGAPIVATAVVAMLVLPLHHVLRRTVNRVIHGQAEDPLVTTTALGRRLGSAVTPDQLTTVVLPEILDGVVRALRLRHLSLVMADGATYSSGGTEVDPLELPLRHAGRPVGTLRVVPARGGLTRAERRAVDDVAAHAAVAAHGVLLMGELQRERERVVVAREEERRRLRRELHDGVGTALAAARLQAESARDLMTEHPREGLALLDRLTVALRDAVHDVRAVTRELRPATLDELGLAGALRELGARSASAGRPVEVDVGELGEVPAAVEVAAYLVAAELVTNACRHSGASRIAVSARRDGELRVRVTDDGCGIGPGAEPGVGLASVRRRVDEVGGRMVHHDGPGTTLEVRLPLESR